MVSHRIFSILPLLISGLSHAHHPSTQSVQLEPAQEPLPPLWLRLIGNVKAQATIREDQQSGYRYIDGDGLPEHPTGRFPNRHNPNRIRAQAFHFKVPLRPSTRRVAVPVSHAAYFGVALNGVPFDPATAEFYQRNPRSGWNEEAIGGDRNLGLDASNAHVQPNGSYHYHGIPTALAEQLKASEQANTLIGYAADGFPIYYQAGQALKPSYRLKEGYRPSGPSDPGGPYDGRYTADWEYRPGSGDLDDCNGIELVSSEYPEGRYAYLITQDFPFVPRCWHGVPDRSFYKRMASGRGAGGAIGGNRSGRQTQGRDQGQGLSRRGPPQVAVDACRDQDSESVCSFEGRFGSVNGQCRSLPDGQVACVPDHHHHP